MQAYVMRAGVTCRQLGNICYASIVPNYQITHNVQDYRLLTKDLKHKTCVTITQSVMKQANTFSNALFDDLHVLGLRSTGM